MSIDGRLNSLIRYAHYLLSIVKVTINKKKSKRYLARIYSTINHIIKKLNHKLQFNKMPGCVGPLFSTKMVDHCQEPDALCSLCPGWARPAAGCRRHSQPLQTLISALHWAAADENSFGYPRPPWGVWHYPTLTITITSSNTNHNNHLPSYSTNLCNVISRPYPNYMCLHLMNKHFSISISISTW